MSRSPADTPAQPSPGAHRAGEAAAPWAQHLLFVLIAALLAVRHLFMFHARTHLFHIHLLTENFQNIDRGTLWVRGEELGNTGLLVGGPLYVWLSYPARLFDNPVLGMHVVYFALNLVCLGAWFYCATDDLLPRRTRWLAAVVLAVLPENAIDLAENMTMMSMLLLPLFVTFVRGLRPGSWRWMVVPGVVAGMAACVHQAALTFVAVLGAALLLQPELRWRRTGAALAGLALVVATIALPSLAVAPPPPGMPVDLGASESPWNTLPYRLTNLLGYPAAVGGLLLAVVWWIRGRAKPGHKVAVLWLLLGGLGAAVALTARDALRNELGAPVPQWRDVRFGVLNPARAVLIAAAAWWLHDHLRRRLPQVIRSELALPLAAALATLALAVPTTLDAQQRYRSRFRPGDALPCRYRLFASDVRSSRHLYPLYAALADDPDVRSGRPLAWSESFLSYDMIMVTRWQDRRPPPSAVERATTVMVPRLPRADLAGLRNTRDYVLGLAVSNVRDARRAIPAAGGPIPLWPWTLTQKRRWLLVAGRGVPAGARVRLAAEASGKTVRVRPVDGCTFSERGDPHFQYHLFDLTRLPAGARDLRVTGATPADPALAPQVLLLPRRRPGRTVLPRP